MSKEKFENIMKGLRVKAGSIVLATGLAIVAPVSTFAKTNKVDSSKDSNSFVAMENEDLSFYDVTDEDDVRQAAERVYNNIKPMLEAENDEVLNFTASHENIEDMIRVLHGELPMNRKFNENTLNQMIQMHADIFANRGHVDNTLYDVKYEYFFEDNTLEAMYAKSYDELYAKIAEARRNNNIGEFIELVGKLGSKIYNEWYLAGLNGGFNPYAFAENDQYLALLTATSRYNNFVLEYTQQNDIVVCIPTCYKGEKETEKAIEKIKYSAEFKEKLEEALRDNNFKMLSQWYNDQVKLAGYEQREINEIMYGLYYGDNQFGETILTRGNNEKFIPFAYAYNNLNNTLLEKSEAKVKVLK